jgi:uncharacterized protein YlbG (UPF0298 family)
MNRQELYQNIYEMHKVQEVLERLQKVHLVNIVKVVIQDMQTDLTKINTDRGKQDE